jgi:serine/threonine protein kinase
MLSAKSYTKASRCFINIVDMWSVGTILAELVAGNPLFKGRDCNFILTLDVDQLNRILAVCGTQDDDTLRRLGSKRALQYIKSLKVMPKLPFSVVIPNATTTCVDLLENLLQFDPEKRFTVEQALEHPYLEAYHDINEEPSHPIPLDFSFELLTTESEMRQAIADEVMQYRSCTMTSLRNGQLKVDPYVESNVSAHGPKNENFQMIVDSVLDIEEELRLKEESASF